MKLEQQVTSLDLSKKLKKLGVKQESAFYYYTESDNKISSDLLPGFLKGSESLRVASAFIVSELGEMLPESIDVMLEETGESYQMLTCLKSHKGNQKTWAFYYAESEAKTIYQQTPNNPFYENTMADASAKMLIYLIEQGIVKP